MNLILTCCLFVLKNEKSIDIRKNDQKHLEVIVDKRNHTFIKVPFDNKSTLKDLIRKQVTKIVGNNFFHLEQVYTFGEKEYYQDNEIHIIYLACMNEENIVKLDNNYELVDFNVINKNSIVFGRQIYSYETKQKTVNNSLEYYHDIKVENKALAKTLLEFIMAYKQIIAKIDYTDICFKFLPNYFTLEDVQTVYEMIKDIKVDKSNFRKKIMHYCEKTDQVIKKGYRPTQVYTFKKDYDDIWI